MAELDELRSVGCPGAQGFFLSPPSLPVSQTGGQKSSLGGGQSQTGRLGPAGQLGDPGQVEQGGGPIAIVGGSSLRALVSGLNRIGVKPPGIIAILQAIKTAGALRAESAAVMNTNLASAIAPPSTYAARAESRNNSNSARPRAR